MHRRFLAFAALILLALSAHAGVVVTAELRGAVSPASAAYFERVLDEARAREAVLVVLSLDTPGGLDTSMRQMIRGMLASPVPVAVFVHPGGARAASAGTYLLYAAHVAAMAPGTNLGAATPIALGGGGDKPAEKEGRDGKAEEPAPDAREAKAVNDAVAYVRSLAELRGRNADWAEQAVREAASLSAGEAAKTGVVDVLANDLAELLRRIDGRRLRLDSGREMALALGDPALVSVVPNWKEGLLAAVADPNIALILMMIGVYGLLFEFYSPGLAIPGVLGGISLLLALYGLALLPVNWVGVALVLLGIALMVGEAFLPSFGVLGMGGIAAFVAGALMLIDPDDLGGISISWEFIVPFALASALAAAGFGVLALRSRRRPGVAGRDAMLGATALALESIEKEGWVRACGERWRARSSAPLASGGEARIVGLEGLTLIVEPKDRGEQG